MARPNNRRNLRLESLETREVLSGPSPDQAYTLALLNLARTSPTAAADRFTTNLDADVQATVSYYQVDLNSVRNAIASSPAKPPLAWNGQIAQAAQGQSQYQADAGVQSHSGANGSSLDQRLANAGYTNTSSEGEDIYAYSKSPMEAMQAFLIDWGVSSNGHRMNIQQPNVSPDAAYREAGIGIVNTNGKVGPQVMTVDFGAQNGAQARLLGLAYNDSNGDNFYEPGEGQPGVTVQVKNLSTGATAQTQTQDAGYYDLALAPGNYEVTAINNGQTIDDRTVTVGNVNVEVDYNLSKLSPIPTPTPTPTPTTAPQVISAATTPTDSTPTTPTPAPAPQKTVVIPQNTVTIPQSDNTPTASGAFNKMFGNSTLFSLTSWGAGA